MGRAIYRFCKFHNYGLECDRAPLIMPPGMDEPVREPRRCGCKPHQKGVGFFPGYSRSHRRKIRKQLKRGSLLGVSLR